ncbi:NmrA/HSCARG family protein [Nocardia sp. IFM 10818]
MTTNHETILVTGATGGQGGAVARSLLSGGWTVRALVRDPGAPAVRELAALGAQVVPGDLDDPESLRAAAQGCHGVFSVQACDIANPAPEVEVRQGKNVVDACAAAEVAHLVYSSVGAAHRGSGVTHFQTKADIEAYIRARRVPATVLRPVFFMENWLHLLPAAIDGERVGSIALDPDTAVQMIALHDIGRIAADVFDHRREFLGERIEIAGDERTVREVAEIFSRIDGVPTRFERQPIEELRAVSSELAAMFGWLENHGYQADLGTLQDRYPGLLSLEAWLTKVRNG